MRSMMFESVPLKRNSVKNSVTISHFKSAQLKKVRHRLNPRLKQLLVLFERNKNAVGIGDFNPFLKEFFVSPNSLGKIKNQSYPLNIKINIKEGSVNREFVHISLLKSVNDKLLSKYLTEINLIFYKQFSPLPVRKRNGRFLTKEEQEMFEPLRLKTIEFQNIEKRFGIHLGKTIIIDMAYYSLFRDKVGNEFAKILTEFKEKFYHSPVVTDAMNNEKLSDIASIVEEENFKNKSEVFFMSMSSLPENIKRTKSNVFNFPAKLIIATEEKYFKEIKKIFRGVCIK
jgi:hypothetical protein